MSEKIYLWENGKTPYFNPEFGQEEPNLTPYLINDGKKRGAVTYSIARKLTEAEAPDRGALGGRYPEIDRSDRIPFVAARRPCISGCGDREIALEKLACSLCHLAGALVADLGVRVYRFGSDAELVYLYVVGVGHHTSDEGGGGARHVGEHFAYQSARAGFGGRDRQSACGKLADRGGIPLLGLAKERIELGCAYFDSFHISISIRRALRHFVIVNKYIVPLFAPKVKTFLQKT
jgi:hypothetical protein